MTDKTYQRQQGGPGPPFAPKAIPSFSTYATVAPQHGPAPMVPSGSTSTEQAGLGQTMDNLALRAGQQQGLRVDQHPGLAFFSGGFQAMCGGGNPGVRPPMSAAPPGFYTYPASASPAYPYGIMEHNMSSPVTLDPERLAAINRALSLPPPAATAAVSAAMAAAGGITNAASEPTWGAASAARVARWPAPAMPSSLSNPPSSLSVPSFSSVPATSSSAKRISPSVSAPKAAAAKPTEPLSVSAVSAVARSPGTAAADGSNGGRGESPAMGNAANGVSTVLDDCIDSEADPEKQDASSRATSDPSNATSAAAAGECAESAHDFELDSTGKRRRLTAEERLQRSRERNQLHARKTRQRKKAQLQILMNRSAELQEEQQRLRQAITDRRTASILLDMSGSEDFQANKAAAPNHDHHRSASADLPSKAFRSTTSSCGVESDDAAGEGSSSGKGNGSDDQGSESNAGTACSVSSSGSGRTSSEANSSVAGGDDGAGGGGGGGETCPDDQPRVGNPGDTERLLELSQKTRSECTPEELEEIRRERNRMHAKRTRDRKKLHLEATEGMIARLEQENRKLRDSMQAIGSGGGGSGGASSVSPTSASVPAATAAAAAATARGVMSSSFVARGSPASAQQPPVAAPQPHSGGGEAAHIQHVQPPSHPLMHQFANSAFLHHGAHMQPQLHAHMYPGQPHHLQHASQIMQAVSAQQQQQHMGYFPPGYDHHGGGGGGSGSPSGASPPSAGAGKLEMNSYLQGGRMPPMGYMGPSGPHYLLPYQQGSSAAFGVPAAASVGRSPSLSSPQQQTQQQQHVYPSPDPSTGAAAATTATPTGGHKMWDAQPQQGCGADATSFVQWANAGFSYGKDSTAPTAAEACARREQKLQQHQQQHPRTVSPSKAAKGGGGGKGAGGDAGGKYWGGSKTASLSNGGSGSTADKSQAAAINSLSAADVGEARHLAHARANRTRAAEQAQEEDEHRLDRDLSRGCREAWQKVRRERSAKRKRSSSNGGDGRARQRLTTSRGRLPDSESERDGVGSGEDGSDCSSSGSSWMESSESSSILPGSTVASETGRGGRCGGSRSSRSDSSIRSNGSPYSSSSGGEDGERSVTGAHDAMSRKLQRRSYALQGSP